MRRWRLVASLGIGILSIALLAAPARAQSQITLDDYVSRLSTTLTKLAAIPVDGRTQSAIGSALVPLGLPVQVALPSGGSVEVTQDSLFGGPPTDLSVVEARITAALDAAGRVTAATPPDRAALAAALTKAYGGRALVAPSFLQRLMSNIGQIFGWLWDHTLGALARSGIGALIGWLLVAGLVALVLLFLRRLRRITVPEGGVARSHEVTEQIDWRRAAEVALAAGDLAEAVRALYHLLLATLAARGVVHDAPSLTAGECRIAVRRQRPALAPAVDEATASFERVVFGKLAARDHDIEVLRTAERAVKNA